MDIHSLPKAELHCHLDGIIDPTMARDILREDPAYPLDVDAFEQVYPVYDFDSFIRWYTSINRIEGRLSNFHPVVAHYVAHLKAQNVRYAEIMIASSEIPADPAEAVEAMRAFRAVVDEAEGGAIQVELLACFGRNKPPERVEQLADRFIPLHAAGLIAGVSLAGPEIGNPVRPFERTFARMHEAGVKIEIHAGEWAGPESVWDALAHGYPDRLGHGVSIFQDEALVERVLEMGIHVEMCPTSNLKTGAITRLEEHPIARALELGMNVGVNTDDPGPFLNSVESEYDLLADVFGFGEQEFEALYRNALVARFVPGLRVET